MVFFFLTNYLARIGNYIVFTMVMSSSSKNSYYFKGHYSELLESIEFRWLSVLTSHTSRTKIMG